MQVQESSQTGFTGRDFRVYQLLWAANKLWQAFLAGNGSLCYRTKPKWPAKCKPESGGAIAELGRGMVIIEAKGAVSLK